MGISSSPYLSCQGIAGLKLKILGKRHDPKNPFWWDHVKTNLPGDSDYDPTKVWIGKYRKDGVLAVGLNKCTDDGRTTASTQEEVWRCSTQVGKQCSHHGVQDALRKHREAS
mmetsp:Transcript_12347/g.17591  ORF Transcript_12347/g.17591 Transcript_12347/m.17591 type:complete len:112 (+) Transcript_12347:2637-2972(+)